MKVSSVSLVIPVAAVLLSSTAFAAGVKDKNLEVAIRASLFDAKGELTDEKLGQLYVLDASGKDIRDLSGMEKCKNLLSLKLTNNHISDVKPLKDLVNLQTVDLAGN